MTKAGMIGLGLLVSACAWIYYAEEIADPPPEQISVVKEGGIMCEIEQPVARILSAKAERALVRTAMTSECRRAYMETQYEFIEKERTGVLKIKDLTSGGRIMYTRPTDVAYRDVEPAGDEYKPNLYTLEAGVIVCNSHEAGLEMLKRGKKGDAEGIQELVDSLVCYETGTDVQVMMRSMKDDVVQLGMFPDGIDGRNAFIPEAVLREYIKI